MNICPKNTLSIIKKLEHLGFNNSHFQFIHHWGNFPEKDSSLGSHKRYINGNIKNYKPGSNDFKVAQKLQKCLDLATTSKGEIDFVQICSQVSGLLPDTQFRDKISINCTSGLYVVTLNNSESISANADDKRIAHIAIKVNKDNCKFGKSVNLKRRKNDYYKTFGEENVNFTPIASLLEIGIAEDEIIKQLYQYRQISPSGNLTEWMKGISEDKVIDLAIETLDNLNISYENLCNNNKGKQSMVNFSQISNKIAEKFKGGTKDKPVQGTKLGHFTYSLPKNYQFDEDAQEAYQALTVEKRPVVFLTGGAGTGKTTFIHYVKLNYKCNSVILSPYGLQALNIGAQTIHSFFRFPFERFENEAIPQYFNEIIAHLDLIILDEISTMESEMLDHIDFALRKWRGSSEPFGGIQLLLVGDCFQNSPFILWGDKKKEFEKKYRSQMFFDAHVFEKIDVAPISLTTIYRQSDPYFINILNKIRIRYDHEKCLNELNQRCYHDKKNITNEEYLILTTKDIFAESINTAKFKEINSPSHIYQATKSGKITRQIEKKIPSPLELKVGAQVMVTKDIDNAAYGTLGLVTNLFNDKVIIEKLDDKQSIECSIETWVPYTYEWDDSIKRITSHPIGEYRQIPLRLGWATTIHKSHGMTFDSVKLDLTGGTFAPGQTYVALSRCRTLEKLTFDKPLSLNDIKIDPRVYEFYKHVFNQEFEKITFQSTKDFGNSQSQSRMDTRYTDQSDFNQNNDDWYSTSDISTTEVDYNNTPLDENTVELYEQNYHQALDSSTQPTENFNSSQAPANSDTAYISKSDFEEKLRYWYSTSNDFTMGSASDSTPLFIIEYNDNFYKLSPDTKRNGVKLYLDLLEKYHGNLTWSVVANANGRMNKVAFGPDKAVLSGIYLYFVDN